MQTLRIDLSDQQAAVLTTKAKAQGLSLEDWLRRIAEVEAASAAVVQLQRNPGEWSRRFDELIDSQDPNTPVLSEEAMSRESIYPDRS